MTALYLLHARSLAVLEAEQDWWRLDPTPLSRRH
jgi:hypothetical protein